jgi:glycosyltransferase involved in cell wall biosynthesis
MLSKQGKYSKIASWSKILKAVVMRVLMVSKACLVGTYQTKLEEIAGHEDIELTVVVPPVWNDPSGPVTLERGHTEGYQLIVDPIRFNGDFHLHHYPKLKQRLAEFQPDILHIDEEPYNLATWLAWRQARSKGIKSLFFSWQNLERRYPFPFNKMEQQVLEGVDYAIMGNQDAVQVWTNKGYSGPHKVIPQFGVDPDRFHPPRSRDYGRGFNIGSANRRLVPEKGVDLLLRAAATLPGIWRVHIAGDGPERPKLKRLASELRISDRVHFDQSISSEAMPAYLRQLDALVLSSRTLQNWKEQFGRVLIEAMACGVPVIGSDSGEIPNVIDSAGLIFAEDDVDALHNHLLELMKSENLRRELGKRGRERVLSMYTQDQIADRTVEVYRELFG